ncbi:MAG: phosphatase PAP2 family protein [Puniceicoccales bacterium]|jgi:membrane-associated phospholipid phosphatase|nr:phosphatase PAP2 family protein [Puniceicoccales bacterium]
MRTSFGIFAFLLTMLFFFVKACIAQEIFVAMGDFLHIAIPCLSFAVSLFYRDKEGAKQFLYALLMMILTTQGIKFLTKDTPIGVRPYGGSKSFPSGHTASSFQGALFLYKRYGWKWGILSIGLAILTAYSRVYGQYHHWRDVVAGLFIAFVINICFVTSLRKRNQLIFAEKY